jgi:hypothetical protein
VVGEEVTEHRMELITSIIRLLLAMVPEQRASQVKEETVRYQVASASNEVDSPPFERDRLEALLQYAPM